jgi:hypothetical protein
MDLLQGQHEEEESDLSDAVIPARTFFDTKGIS